MSTLLNLDDALLAYVLSFLTPRELGVVSRVCSYCRTHHVDGRATDAAGFPNAVNARAARLQVTLQAVAGAPRARCLQYAEEVAAWRGGGRVKSTIDARTNDTCGLALHPDGERLAATWPGGDKKAVGVWSMSSGEWLCILTGHPHEVGPVALDGDMLVSGGRGGALCVWSLGEAALVSRLEGDTLAVEAVAVRGRTVLSGGRDCTVKMWSLDAMACTATILMTGRVCCVAFAGDEALSGGESNTLESWSLADGARRLVMEHPRMVWDVSVQGELAATGCDDGVVRTWSLVDGTCNRELHGHTDRVLTVSLRGPMLASGCEDGALKVWALSDGGSECVTTLKAEKDTWGTTCVVLGRGFIVSGQHVNTGGGWFPGGSVLHLSQ